MTSPNLERLERRLDLLTRLRNATNALVKVGLMLTDTNRITLFIDEADAEFSVSPAAVKSLIEREIDWLTAAINQDEEKL